MNNDYTTENNKRLLTAESLESGFGILFFGPTVSSIFLIIKNNEILQREK